MAFIGNSVQNQGFAPAVDYFNGDGTTVTFTLSRPVASVAQLTAVIENVIQNPATAFTVSGNQITFTSAPPAGTNNVWMEYTSLITQYNGISQDPSVVGDITASGGYLATGDFGNSYIDGTIVDYVTGNARITTGPIDDMTFYHGGTSSRQEMMSLYYAGGAKIFGNTALTIPVGTTAQRPGTPAVGMIRFNTTLGYQEYYNGTNWYQLEPAPYTVEYLVVAGGGAGGSAYGGGGGAGGYIASSATVATSTTYTVTVGSGGAPAPSGYNNGPGGSGGNSSVSGSGLSATAIGGGGGGSGNNPSSYATSGGSGGGGIDGTTVGSGTSGQGNAGGSSVSSGNYGAGGGGGAGAAGSNGTTTAGGTGGVGLNWQSLGTYYAGGGGGGTYNGGTPGAGGNGGGGSSGGVSPYPQNGNAGTANRGGGGGGASASPYTTQGGAGGSGVVIIRYAGAQRGTGGTVTSSGGYTYHTFTTSGTFTA